MMTTILDIAKATRHSTATVDRVLNSRPGVRESTRQVILKAAAEMRYARLPPPSLTFDFVLPSLGGFIRNLAQHILRIAEGGDLGRSVNVHFVNYDAPEELVELLNKLHDQSAGVGLVALDHSLIREALSGLIRRNVPVVTLLTDISSLPHQGYIGADNRLAGRLAGHLIGRFLGGKIGKVAIFTGSRAYRGHEEREMGFRSIVRENFSALYILDALEIGESDQSGYGLMKELLKNEPDLAAVYNIGAGTQGIAQALQEVPPDKKPVLIAHDLSADTRTYLLSGAIDVIIDQHADLTADRALARLKSAVDLQMLGVCGVMDSRIVLRDNIPQK
jgi:LacI family transcriptional regulator